MSSHPPQRLQGWGARERRKTKDYEKDFDRDRDKKEEMVSGGSSHISSYMYMYNPACTMYLCL